MKENWVYRRGDIYLANLGVPIGSKQGGVRPVSLSLTGFYTTVGCNPTFAAAIPLRPCWASWRAVEGSFCQ